LLYNNDKLSKHHPSLAVSGSASFGHHLYLQQRYYSTGKSELLLFYHG